MKGKKEPIHSDDIMSQKVIEDLREIAELLKRIKELKEDIFNVSRT